jgi:thiamine biosynthesis lipoprotein
MPKHAAMSSLDDGPYLRSWAALGTTVTVMTCDSDGIGTAAALLRGALEAIDRTCSRFSPSSEISRVHAAGGRPVRVSRLLCDAVGVALDAAEHSDGAVDPTVGLALISLGYDRDFAAIDSDGPDAPATHPAPGWRCIELERSSQMLTVPSGVLLDLGATAKAFVADRSASQIAEAIGGPVLVNLGGDIAAVGAPPGGWAIGLARAAATLPEESDAVVAISGGGVASSATAVRRWRRGAHTVHHIIDPRTGASATSPWELVTVAAPSCVAANVASTAAIVAGSSGVDVLRRSGFPARLVGLDGTVTALNGWPPDTRPASHPPVAA